MSRRRGARRIALEVLYESDLSGSSSESVLSRFADRKSVAFAKELVRGVEQHRKELDDLIGSLSEEWAVDRMPVIDRNVLRLGAYELLFDRDTPRPVVINEAIELAKEYSTEDSGRFINGVLAAIPIQGRE
ncbi:MAG: transcription antitermination factor NusB [Actinobacteria bacterium]|nr:transcription antitermination factor NusB [Actinomycetota bacterium]